MFASTLIFVLRVQDPVRLVKTVVKKELRTSAVSLFLVTNSPLPFHSGTIFSFCFSFFFFLLTWRTIFCIFVTSLANFILRWAFALLAVSQHTLAMHLSFSMGIYPLPSLVHFFFGFEQTQKLAVKPTRSLAPPSSLTFKGDELFIFLPGEHSWKTPSTH